MFQIFLSEGRRISRRDCDRQEAAEPSSSGLSQKEEESLEEIATPDAYPLTPPEALVRRKKNLSKRLRRDVVPVLIRMQPSVRRKKNLSKRLRLPVLGEHRACVYVRRKKNLSKRLRRLIALKISPNEIRQKEEESLEEIATTPH